MTREEMLARLIAQATTEGGDLVTLRAMVEEATEVGAERALHRLGLSDAEAQDDVEELRELLQAWRDAKSSARNAAIQWIVRAVFALLLIGIAVRLGAGDLLR